MKTKFLLFSFFFSFSFFYSFNYLFAEVKSCRVPDECNVAGDNCLKDFPGDFVCNCGDALAACVGQGSFFCGDVQCYGGEACECAQPTPPPTPIPQYPTPTPQPSCGDPSANNYGSPLPCTYNPVFTPSYPPIQVPQYPAYNSYESYPVYNDYPNYPSYNSYPNYPSYPSYNTYNSYPIYNSYPPSYNTYNTYNTYPPSFSLTVTKTGGGTLKSVDNFINCGLTCSKTYVQGANVTLKATPSSSYWKFSGWSGDCSGTGDCVLIINSAKSVTGKFVPRNFIYKEF